jgi:hypothetical protein
MKNDTCTLIPLDKIHDNPAHHRDIDKDEHQKLEASMSFHGLLHPIGVTPIDGTGEYTLVWGRGRFLAAQNLGWTEIAAHVVEADDTEQEMLRITENLHRSDRGLDRALQMKRYNELMEAQGIKRRKPGRYPDPNSTNLVELDGPRGSTNQRLDRIAREFTEDELKVMKFLDIPVSTAEAILKAANKDDVIKKRILSGLVGGRPIAEAIAQATDPEANTVKVGDRELIRNRWHPEQSEAGTEHMPDKEWLQTQCGAVRDRLVAAKNHHCFDDNALLYRRVRGPMAKFKSDCLKTTLSAKEKGRGGFLVGMLYDVFTLAHPSKWVICDRCDGTGRERDMYCGKCHGDGFLRGKERI